VWCSLWYGCGTAVDIITGFAENTTVSCSLTNFYKKQNIKFAMSVFKISTYVYNLQMTEMGDAYKIRRKS